MSFLMTSYVTSTDLLKERDLLNGTARSSPQVQHQPALPSPAAADPVPPRLPPPRPERPASLGKLAAPPPPPPTAVSSAQRPVSVPSAVLSRPAPGECSDRDGARRRRPRPRREVEMASPQHARRWPGMRPSTAGNQGNHARWIFVTR